MAITESERRDLYAGLERSIGSKEANNLMQLLPNEPAASLVTRDDMHANTTMLRGEMAELRGEMAELRGAMSAIRGEIREKFGYVEARFGAIDEKFAELRVDMSARFDQQQRWMIGLVVMIILAVVGSSIGVVIVQGA